MYDYGGLKTKLEWKVAVQWAGEAKQEMEESKQFMWVRVTTLYRPSKHKLTTLPNQPSASAFSSDFVPLTPEYLNGHTRQTVAP